jgi:hypothetical protein
VANTAGLPLEAPPVEGGQPGGGFNSTPKQSQKAEKEGS